MYLALYRKYRPSTFDDVISQEHITVTLKNQIKTGETAHAYLFTGSRGTGKTSCAKILAKAINCLTPNEGNPCGTCQACIETDSGATDITEMDAASNNGVDDVRALREEVAYTPVSLKKRIYIIDEVHMLSSSAFNALLKTLEEPPSHVVFILATTEIHKVPATILSRCQRFEFKRIDMDESAKLLTQIAQNENASLDNDAALLISRLSDGGMRDAISLLDQCISMTKNVTAEIVREFAQISDKSYLFTLVDAILMGNTATALSTLDDLHSASKDISRLFEELILHFRNLMLIKLMDGDNEFVNSTPDEIIKYKSQAENLGINEIMQKLSLLQEYLVSFSSAKNRKILAEMCLVKLTSPKLDNDVDALLNRIDKLEEQLAKLQNGVIPLNFEKKPEVKEIPKPLESAKPIETAKPTESTTITEEKGDEEPVKSEEIDEIPLPPEPSDLPWEEDEIANSDEVENSNEVLAQSNVDEKDEIVEEVSEVPQNKSSEKYEKVPDWLEIVEEVPHFIGSLLSSVEPVVVGNDVKICTDKIILKDFLSNPGDEGFIKLKKAIEKRLGRSITLSCECVFDGAKEIENKLESVLEKAKNLGYKVYIKN